MIFTDSVKCSDFLQRNRNFYVNKICDQFMTCKKCGYKEVLYQENSENSILRCCPVCDKLRVLSKEESRKLIAPL